MPRRRRRRARPARCRRCTGRRAAAGPGCAARARRRARRWSGARSGSPSGSRTSGRSVWSAPASSSSRAGLLVALEVDPGVGDVVAREEHLHVVAAVAPQVPDDPHHRAGVGVVLAPGLEQVVDDRVERALGRLPRLEHVVVEADVVDRPDRDVGVGVGREQQQPGVGGGLAHPRHQLDAGHARHPLVGDEESDGARAQGQLGEDTEGLVAGGRAHHAVVGPVAGAQVAHDGAGHLRVVVDGEDRRPVRHPRLLRARGRGSP